MIEETTEVEVCVQACVDLVCSMVRANLIAANGYLKNAKTMSKASVTHEIEQARLWLLRDGPLFAADVGMDPDLFRAWIKQIEADGWRVPAHLLHGRGVKRPKRG